MKNIIALLIIILTFNECFSQTFPLRQQIANKDAILFTKGAMESQTGFIFAFNYGDTATANSAAYISSTPGIVIRVSNTQFWVRNQAANAWIQIGGSGTTYTAGTNISISGGNVITTTDSIQIRATGEQPYIIRHALLGAPFPVAEMGPTTAGQNFAFDIYSRATTNSGDNGRTWFDVCTILNTGAPLLATRIGVTDTSSQIGARPFNGASQQSLDIVMGTTTAIKIRPSNSVALLTTARVTDTANYDVLLRHRTSGDARMINPAVLGALIAPTLQQVLTAGSTLTGNNTITNGSNTLTIDNSTLTTQTGVALSANILTTGNILELSSTSGGKANGSEILNIITSGNNITDANFAAIRIGMTDNYTAGTVRTGLDVTVSGLGTNYGAKFLRGRVSFGTLGTESGLVEFNGSTSGTVSIQPAAAAGTYTLTLPTALVAGGVLTDVLGNGVLSFAVPSGSSTWNGITNPTGDQALTFDAGESSTWTSSNTTEDLFTVNSSTTTTSSLFSLNRTGTALASGNNIMELISSGANGTNAITASGLVISVTNTNATSGTNIGLNVTASGATTSNLAINAVGSILMNGNSLSLAPSSGTNVFSMTSSAGAFTTTFTYDASRNFISDYRDGEVIRVAGANVAAFTSTGFAINGGGGTAADFTVRGVGFNPFVFVDVSANAMGIAQGTPSAYLHIGAGTATAGTAPLKLTTGTSLTVAVAGSVEFTTDDLFFTITTGAARKRLLMADPVGGLTATRVSFATTNGRLTDDADLTFDGTNLTVGGTVTASNISSGTFSPTISAETNCTTSISTVQYMRVGNTVIVAGTFTIDPVLTATATSFRMDLPVTSNFTQSNQAGGTAFCATIAGMGAGIVSRSSDTVIELGFVSTDIGSNTMSFSFTYQIL